MMSKPIYRLHHEWPADLAAIELLGIDAAHHLLNVCKVVLPILKEYTMDDLDIDAIGAWQLMNEAVKNATDDLAETLK